MTVRFQYRQASTGSRILELAQSVPADDGTGVVEFAIAGDSYLKGGRVLAWRMLLIQNVTDPRRAEVFPVGIKSSKVFRIKTVLGIASYILR